MRRERLFAALDQYVTPILRQRVDDRDMKSLLAVTVQLVGTAKAFPVGIRRNERARRPGPVASLHIEVGGQNNAVVVNPPILGDGHIAHIAKNPANRFERIELKHLDRVGPLRRDVAPIRGHRDVRDGWCCEEILDRNFLASRRDADQQPNQGQADADESDLDDHESPPSPPGSQLPKVRRLCHPRLTESATWASKCRQRTPGRQTRRPDTPMPTLDQKGLLGKPPAARLPASHKVRREPSGAA